MSRQQSLPHILLIGSTGRTGRLLLVEALKRGYKVTALARTPTSLDSLRQQLPPSQQNGLNIVQGNSTSVNDLKSALHSSRIAASENQLVIISTLGQTRKSGNPWSAVTSPAGFMTESAAALITVISSLSASEKSRISKLVVMSMFGAGSSFDNLHCLIKPVMNHSNMAQTVDDHNGIDAVVRGQNEVTWAMVRPSMLKDGEALPVKVRSDNGEGEGWMPSSVTMGTVVEFLLSCVLSGEWDGKTPVICN